MIHLSIFLVILLILPALCYLPAEYGFTDNGDGNYFKDGVNPNGSPYRIWMSFGSNGRANFWRDGPSYGNGVGSIDLTNDIYLAEGWGKPGLPITGWGTPGAPRTSMGTSGRQTYSNSYGDFDADQHAANMQAMAQGMRQMQDEMRAAGFGNRGGSNFNMINNVGGTMNGKMNGGVYGSSIGTSTINNYGDYYAILYTKTKTDSDCTEKIVIQGIADAPTKAINDEFKQRCTTGGRSMHWQGPQMMVGKPDQNFCAYGNVVFPDQLVVIEDGVCKIKTYSLTSATNLVTTLETDKCDKVKTLLQSIQGELENGNREGTDSQGQLKDLVKKLSGKGGVDETSSIPSGPKPGRPTKPTVNYSYDPPLKKKHGLLKRIWIFIKNVFRTLTGRPTKDE